MDNVASPQYKIVIEEIENLRWPALTDEDLYAIATAYYYFSIQFRENLLTAVELFPEDDKLQHLKSEEFDTANLSPWPGVASAGERMNHDEFMRRTLLLSDFSSNKFKAVHDAGQEYLDKARAYNADTRARSISSYEDGGLEATFRAILTAPGWNTPALQAFHHFLAEHIRFDSDPEQGHGALSRHLQADDRVLPLWEDFRDLLILAAPALVKQLNPVAV